ncbi:MAG: hypothetical protein LIO87_05680 [Eubacterium sp.]|nr:hypothetical protein [Eubacterium sp.]
MSKKNYLIYLSDYPADPIRGTFSNKAEARKAAKLYIKRWKLEATVLNIEEVILWNTEN